MRSDEVLVRLAQGGDVDATEALLGRKRPWVRSLARGFYVPGYMLDDLEQVGMMGLLEAVRTYLPTHGATFKTFAYHCIRAELVSEIVGPRSGPYWQPLPEGYEEVGSDGLADGVVSDLEAARLQGWLDGAKAILSAIEEAVLSIYVDDPSGSTGRGIPKYVLPGYSRKQIDNALQRALRKVRKASGAA